MTFMITLDVLMTKISSLSPLALSLSVKKKCHQRIFKPRGRTLKTE